MNLKKILKPRKIGTVSGKPVVKVTKPKKTKVKKPKTVTISHSAKQKVKNKNFALKFRIKKIKCIDETKGKGAEKFAKDEIAWRAIIIDDKGKVTKTSQKIVPKKFNDGDSYNYNGLDLVTFKLDDNYPKYFHIKILLAELDNKGFSKTIDQIYSSIKKDLDKLTEEAAKLAAKYAESQGVPGASAAAPSVANIQNTLRDWTVKLGAKLFLNKDDIFPPQVADLLVRKPDGNFGGKLKSPEEKLIYSGHKGKYQVTCDWVFKR